MVMYHFVVVRLLWGMHIVRVPGIKRVALSKKKKKIMFPVSYVVEIEGVYDQGRKLKQ